MFRNHIFQSMIMLLVFFSPQANSSETATNVVCDKCVNSADIATNAVHSSNIKDKAVTTVKIDASAVTTGKIKNGAVTSGKIKKSAVTRSKIKSGAVSRGKLATDVMATLDNVADNFNLINDIDERTTNLENTQAIAIVEAGSSSGVNYPDPLTAMADLATWCGTPSVGNPCLIQILPGVYDLGADPLTMTPYVDIAGSGENVTRLTSSNTRLFSGTLVGARNSRLSNLTLENTGSAFSNGIYLDSSVTADFSVKHVTIKVSSGSSGGRGVLAFGGVGLFDDITIDATAVGIASFGFNASGGTQTVVNSVINVSGGSSNNSGVLFNNNGSVIIRGSTISASGNNAEGLFVASDTTSGSATVQFSVIEGDASAVQMGAAFTLSASHSQLIGGVTASGTRTCVFVADGLVALDAACQ